MHVIVFSLELVDFVGDSSARTARRATFPLDSIIKPKSSTRMSMSKKKAWVFFPGYRWSTPFQQGNGLQVMGLREDVYRLYLRNGVTNSL
jgi:hypothetical protein